MAIERRREDSIAKEAADASVRKTFAILGVDIDDPRQVEEFREVLRFAKRMNRIAEHGTLAVVAVFAAAMCAAVWAGIVSKIQGGH